MEYSLQRFLQLFSRLRCLVLAVSQPQSTPSHFLTSENFPLLLLSERLIISPTPSRTEIQINYRQATLKACKMVVATPEAVPRRKPGKTRSAEPKQHREEHKPSPAQKPSDAQAYQEVIAVVRFHLKDNLSLANIN
jgi:hypothetical protein